MTPFLLRFIKTVIFLLCLWGLLFLNWWSGKIIRRFCVDYRLYLRYFSLFLLYGASSGYKISLERE